MLSPQQQALCYTLLAPTPAGRARLANHPHFAVLRECIERGALTVIPDACTAALTETPDGPLLLPATDHVLLPIVARYGAFQRDDLLRAIGWLRARGLVRGGLFVDVGANVGTQTLTALVAGGFSTAIAVEPEAVNHRLLTLNMRLNGLSDRVEIVHAALGDREGTAALVVNPDNCGDCRLAPSAVHEQHFEEAGFAAASAPMTSFDRVIEGRGDLGLVWMDTQGSEGLILAASRVLCEQPVPLHVEFWPYGMAALDAYPAFKQFVEAHCSGVAWFEGATLYEEATDCLDALYARFEKDDRFIDLMLLR